MFYIAQRWRAWIVVIMLFLFMVINFADKSVIGLAALPIMHDLGLSPQQLGLVGSSFFLLFSVSGVLFGFAANRIKMKWLLALLSIVWAAVQFPLVGTVSLPLLITCRLLLGAGEGPAYPLALHTTYKWFEDGKRNVPTAIVQQGTITGMLVAGPCLTFLIIHYDWHSTFLALGIAGCLWTALWLLVGAEGTVDEQPEVPTTHVAPAGRRVPYRQLAADPTLLGSLLLCFVGYTVIALGITWFPAYLHLGLGYPRAEVGWLFALIVGGSIPASLVASYISQWLTGKGVPSRLSRGLMTSVPTLVAGIALLTTTASLGAGMKVACLCITTAFGQLCFLFCPLMIGEVTPAKQRGAWLGINNSIAALGGLIAPALMGHFIGNAHGSPEGFEYGFIVLGCLLVPTGLLGIWMLDPERSVRRFQQYRIVPDDRDQRDGDVSVPASEKII
ncbi:MFS transporter [Paraburkholderia sediminicola]|uniref:MFS transporter n=1 Tax=Paraburkholderia sediminicola TaxID=458836 RepID=UPI0038BA47E0